MAGPVGTGPGEPRSSQRAVLFFLVSLFPVIVVTQNTTILKLLHSLETAKLLRGHVIRIPRVTRLPRARVPRSAAPVGKVRVTPAPALPAGPPQS